MRFLFLILCAFSSGANAQIYKCKAPDGAVTVQQTPCASSSQGGPIVVRPGSGHSPVTVQQISDQKSATAMRGPPAGSSFVDKVNKLENERLVRELTYERDSLMRERANLGGEMDKKIALLRTTKAGATNNLAGATWEQSLSTEMLAIAETYKVKAGLVEIKLADVDKQLNALSKKQPLAQ